MGQVYCIDGRYDVGNVVLKVKISVVTHNLIVLKYRNL